MNDSEFNLLWNTVIVPEAKYLESQFPDIFFAEYLKDEIKQECFELISYCKHHYMKFKEKYVDRHKVSAAVMIALLRHSPIKK